MRDATGATCYAICDVSDTVYRHSKIDDRRLNMAGPSKKVTVRDRYTRFEDRTTTFKDPMIIFRRCTVIFLGRNLMFRGSMVIF
jgi:hypothetical protein